MATLVDDKEKNGKCRCCLTEGRHRDFRFSYEDLKHTNSPTAIECYSDLFFDCYKFPLILDNTTTLICWDCIEKLKGAFEFKNNVMKSTTQLLLISVTNQNFTDVKNNIVTNVIKDKNENFKEYSANVVNAESNVHETDAGIHHISENKDLNETKDSVESPNNDTLTETDEIVSKAFKSVPDVVAKKCKNMILNGIKVTVVKCDKDGIEIEPIPNDVLGNTELNISTTKQNGSQSEGSSNAVLPLVAQTKQKQSPNHDNTLSTLRSDDVRNETTLKPTRKRKNIERVYVPEADRDLSPPDPYADSGDDKDWSPSKTQSSDTAESGKEKDQSPSPKRQRRHTLKSKETEGKRRKKREEEAERQKEAEKTPWPIPLRSYSGRKQRQLNKIQVSKFVLIRSDSQIQSFQIPGEANALQSDDANKITKTSPSRDINGDPSTITPTEQPKIDLNNANHNIEDQFVDKTLLKPETTTCDPGMSPTLPEVGSLSFAASQFDSLKTPIASLLASRELVRVEHKRISLVTAADVATPKPKSSKENKPWRLEVKDKAKRKNNLKKITKPSKAKSLENQTNDSVKETPNTAVSNKSEITNKILGQNEEDEEEIKARRQKLLSGYVRKTVKVDQNVYKEHMKELLKREETVAYRCKKCGSLYLSEFSLLEHKKTHEQEDLQPDAVKQDVFANGQSKKSSNKKAIAKLSIAPGVKEVLNPMYKMNNDPNIEGPMIIYASGNCFYKSSTTPDARIVWVCKTHHHCTATLNTRGDEIVDYNNNHTPRLSTPFKIVTAPTKEMKLRNGSDKKSEGVKNKNGADQKTKAMEHKNASVAKTNEKKRKIWSIGTENEMKIKNGSDEKTAVLKRKTRSNVKTEGMKNKNVSNEITAEMEHKNGCDGEIKVTKRKRVSGAKAAVMDDKNVSEDKATPKKNTPKRTYSREKKEILINNEDPSESKAHISEIPSNKSTPKRESRKQSKSTKIKKDTNDGFTVTKECQSYKTEKHEEKIDHDQKVTKEISQAYKSEEIEQEQEENLSDVSKKLETHKETTDQDMNVKENTTGAPNINGNKKENLRRCSEDEN